MLKLLGFSLIFFPMIALSRPENVRFGYKSCSSCHVSPTGGGALNRYGRSTINEFVSFPVEFAETDEIPIIVGGNARYLSYWEKSDGNKQRNSFLMEADIEAGFSWNGITGIAEYGTYYSGAKRIEGTYSHYIKSEFKNHSIRIGKFSPSFGINDPNHYLPGRNRVGFDYSSASYNLELIYTGRFASINLTNIFGCQGGYLKSQEKGYCSDGKHGGTATIAVYPRNWLNIGVSGAYLHNADENFAAISLHGVIGSKSIYSVFDFSLSDYNKRIFLDPFYNGWFDIVYDRFGLKPSLGIEIAEEDVLISTKLRFSPIGHVNLSGSLKYNFETKRESAQGIIHFYL